MMAMLTSHKQQIPTTRMTRTKATMINIRTTLINSMVASPKTMRNTMAEVVTMMKRKCSRCANCSHNSHATVAITMPMPATRTSKRADTTTVISKDTMTTITMISTTTKVRLLPVSINNTVKTAMEPSRVDEVMIRRRIPRRFLISP